MTSVDGKTPRLMPVTAAKSDLAQEGLVLKDSGSNTLELVTAKGDAAVGVLDQAFVDSVQATKTTVAGDRVGVFILGSGAVVRMASITGVTYVIGNKIYVDDTNDGMVSGTAATSTPVGHYVGDGETTTANGDLVDVVLDVMVDATPE